MYSIVVHQIETLSIGVQLMRSKVKDCYRYISTVQVYYSHTHMYMYVYSLYVHTHVHTIRTYTMYVLYTMCVQLEG